MKDSSAFIAAVSLGTILTLALSAPIVLSGYSSMTGGQGGPFFGEMPMMNTQGQTVTVDQAIQMMNNVPEHEEVEKHR